MRVQTRILQAISEWKRPVEGKEFGSVGCCDRTRVSDSVELSEDFTDIFLSQVSMLTDWDVLTLQECSRKLDGANVGTHELFTPPELLGAVIANQKWSGQSKIAGSAARWTAVELGGQLTFSFQPICHRKERNCENSKQF